jgi:hypothetical protein
MDLIFFDTKFMYTASVVLLWLSFGAINKRRIWVEVYNISFVSHVYMKFLDLKSNEIAFMYEMKDPSRQFI